MSCYSLLFHSASQHFDAFSGLFTKVFTFENFVRVNFLLIISNSYFLNSEDRGIPDESDRFMMDPFGFASDYAKNWSVPSHIVLFDSEEKLLIEFLISHSFKQVHLIFPFFFFCLLFSHSPAIYACLDELWWQVKSFFHTHFKVDRDHQASVVVYSSTGQWSSAQSSS